MGRGSTAASSALLLQEPDRGLSELHERYGGRKSRRLWQLSHSALAELVALLERHRVPCQLRPRDTIYYATTAAAAEDLARELAVRKRAGFKGEWLSTGELRRLTAIPGAGAIRTHGGAQCDPVSSVRRCPRCGGDVRHARVRALACRPDYSPTKRSARDDETRSGRRAPRHYRDRLCHTAVQAPRWSFPDVPHVRARD